MSASNVREMLPAERRARIVAALRRHPAVRVAALSEELGVSEITIRRDLLLLEQEGVLARTYGGAMRRQQRTDEPGYEDNALIHAAQKDRIAQAAAAMIEPRDTVFLGSGTTVAQMLRYIDPKLVARMLFGMAFGLLHEWRGNVQPGSFVDYAPIITEFFFHGVSSKPKTGARKK